MFTNPFTAKLNADLTPITEPTITETEMPEPILPVYDPTTQTVIDTTELESLKASVDQFRSAHTSLNERIGKVQGGFRNFLRSLWDHSDLDNNALNEVFEEYGLPVGETEYIFSATVSIRVDNIVGKGRDADEAWDNVDDDAIREAFDNGNYDTWTIDKPYRSDDSTENDDSDNEPDYAEASIYNLI